MLVEGVLDHEREELLQQTVAELDHAIDRELKSHLLDVHEQDAEAQPSVFAAEVEVGDRTDVP